MISQSSWLLDTNVVFELTRSRRRGLTIVSGNTRGCRDTGARVVDPWTADNGAAPPFTDTRPGGG